MTSTFMLSLSDTCGTRPLAEGGRDRRGRSAFRSPTRWSSRGSSPIGLDRSSRQLATRRMTQVPGGAQNFLEWLIEGALRPAREHHRPAPGRADVLVLRHHLHLHPRRELDRPHARRRHDRLGPPDAREGFIDRPAALARRQCRSQPDAGDGADLLRAAGSSGRCRKSACAASLTELFAPKGETTGRHEAADGRRVLRRRTASRSSRSSSGPSR